MAGGRRDERAAAARRLAERHGATVHDTLPPASWPFVRDMRPALPAGPAAIIIPDLHAAFPAGQTPGTRLVLTQSTYQLQRWLDWIGDRPDLAVVAHASRSALERGAPEAFARRGPWHAIDLVVLDGDDEPAPGEMEPAARTLQNAFAANPTDRLGIFASAAERQPDNAALHLAVASARMELDQLPDAQAAIEHARALAPDWEAVPFECGKLWLRGDDLERAAEQFGRAAQLMPSFSAALSNLGAALGETDRPDQAIEALRRALVFDPNGHTILNNLSVLYRETGRLEEAVEAAQRVTELAPEFVFGHYNRAHALFLQGRFADARDAYERGYRRDPQKNPVQGCRLAMARAGCGDFAGAAYALATAAEALGPENREAVLDEVDEILSALSGLPGAVLAELGRLREYVRVQRKTGA